VESASAGHQAQSAPYNARAISSFFIKKISVRGGINKQTKNNNGERLHILFHCSHVPFFKIVIFTTSIEINVKICHWSCFPSRLLVCQVDNKLALTALLSNVAMVTDWGRGSF